MFSTAFFKLLTIPFLAATHVFAAQNSLQQVTNFGSNPTNAGMYVYRPNGLASNPALIVAIHYCGGTAQAYFSGTEYSNLADSLKSYLVIYPNAPANGGCWDVATTASLTHNGGGDTLAIVSMIKYAIANYAVDPARVYATGTSSGAMMTGVLAGAYPEIIAAGSAWAGIPFGCLAGNLWNTECSGGRLSKTGQQWGDLIRNAYPGYTGARPKLQLWHGTQDEVLNYNNHLEAIKQWTNIFGYSTTPISVQTNNPLQGWTRNIYGPNFQAITTPTTHNIPVQANEVLTWFGLIGGTPGTSTTVLSTTTSTTVAPTTTTTPGPTQVQYGQCGGTGWTGPTVCQSPFTCKVLNPYYHQVNKA